MNGSLFIHFAFHSVEGRKNPLELLAKWNKQKLFVGFAHDSLRHRENLIANQSTHLFGNPFRRVSPKLPRFGLWCVRP